MMGYSEQTHYKVTNEFGQQVGVYFLKLWNIFIDGCCMQNTLSLTSSLTNLHRLHTGTRSKIFNEICIER